MRAVLIDLASATVVNTFTFDSADDLTAANVAQAPQARWIGDTDWVAGSTPDFGDQWDGNVPALFVTPAAPAAPTTQAGAFAAIAAAQTALAQAIAAAAAFMGS